MKRLIFSGFLIFMFGVFAAAQSTNAICPKIEVMGGGMVQSGEQINFTAKLGDEARNFRIEYEWKVSNGKIASGQGTSSIVVDTSETPYSANVTATVKVKGLPASCENTASETGSTMPEIPNCPLAEYGKLTFEEERSRIDQFLAELGNNPRDEGLISIALEENESLAQGRKYVGKIIGHLKFRKFPLDRITLTIVESESRLTTHWRVAEGAEFPRCEKCLVIKAEEF